MSRNTSRRIRAANKKPVAKAKPVLTSVPNPIQTRINEMLRADADTPVPQELELFDNEIGKDTFRVALIADNKLDYPDLYMTVYVEGNKYEESQFAEAMVRASCRKAKTPDEADVVIFTGGPDVDPALYGEERHPMTLIDSARDTEDIKLFAYCVERGIPMLGVCRGAQFLHVMNGGKLYQHINHHTGDHTMWDVFGKDMIERISSVHHQSCRPNGKEMTIIGTSVVASERWLNPKDCHRGTIEDIEAFFYRDTCCLGVQGHPEYRNYPFYTRWWLKQIERYIVDNVDIAPINCQYRIKPDILAQRGFGHFTRPEIQKQEA